jgi:hypothetical protein
LDGGVTDVLIALGIPAALAICIWQILVRRTNFSLISRCFLAILLPSVAVALLIFLAKGDQTTLAVLSKLGLGIFFQVATSAGIIAILELARSRHAK